MEKNKKLFTKQSVSRSSQPSKYYNGVNNNIEKLNIKIDIHLPTLI